LKGAKMNKIMISLFCLILGLGFLGQANATLIDFRNPSFDPGSSASSLTKTDVLGDLDITFTPDPVSATLYWDGTDGLGVKSSYEYDEVENPELLSLSFSKSVMLSSVLITDFFNETRHNLAYDEIGWYALDLNDLSQFDTYKEEFYAYDLMMPELNAGNGQGTLFIGESINSITFSAPGRMFSLQDHEFSVAGVDVTAAPTPEPATFLLIGTGLVGFAVPRIRKKFKK
jgi:hypothetical protein